MSGVRVGRDWFVPVASNLEPAQVQRQEVVTIRNIGPNRTGFYIKHEPHTRARGYHLPAILPGSVTYRHIVHVQSLRTCLFSSDAAQWWQGVWPCPHQVGHGLDTAYAGGRVFSARGGPRGGWAAAYRRKDLVNLFHFSSGPT